MGPSGAQDAGADAYYFDSLGRVWHMTGAAVELVGHVAGHPPPAPDLRPEAAPLPIEDVEEELAVRFGMTKACRSCDD